LSDPIETVPSAEQRSESRHGAMPSQTLPV
jgi:hypothetical protein